MKLPWDNMSILDILLALLVVGVVVYAAIAGYLFVFQRKILYHPIGLLGKPGHYGLMGVQQETIRTQDGVNITVWFKPAPLGKPIIVYFQGNRANLGDRTEKFKAFLQEDMGLLAVSYRGYGSSEGSPSEAGFYEDGRAAMQFLKNKNIPYNTVILYGESLGSGVAVQLASEFPVAAMALEAPYTSIATRAQDLYPYIPVRLLLKDHFNSIEKIGNIRVPVLIFHGYLDQVMPIHYGRQMLEAANEPKEAHFYSEIGHTDFDPKELARITLEFYRKHH